MILTTILAYGSSGPHTLSLMIVFRVQIPVQHNGDDSKPAAFCEGIL